MVRDMVGAMMRLSSTWVMHFNYRQHKNSLRGYILSHTVFASVRSSDCEYYFLFGQLIATRIPKTWRVSWTAGMFWQVQPI